MTKKAASSFLCPHCHKPIDPKLLIAERQRELGKRKRPGAVGLVRNPKGRPKEQESPKP